MTAPIPCPFCGSARVLLIERRDTDSLRLDEAWWHAVCGGCAARGPMARSEEDAVGRWNERARISLAAQLPIEEWSDPCGCSYEKREDNTHRYPCPTHDATDDTS